MIMHVNLGEQGYDIVVEKGALERCGEELNLKRKVLVVTDSGVPSQYADAVAANCAQSVRLCVPAGEASKSFEQFQHLLSVMLHNSFTRRDCVVAVGGGVVGDLSAFAASCYMRGIDFYNIPTTLLSQVDSSIGGKTAIDLDGVKNIVGSFYQPKKVIIDPDTLATLDKRQLSAGLAEAIKMAATCDEQAFSLIENCDELTAALPGIIIAALKIKASVVEKDPTETGLRKVLNFGHTIGHAVESLNNGSLLHGECVALGMLPMCSDPVRSRLSVVLEKYGLPTRTQAEASALLPYILHDKKATDGGITAVVVDEIGSFRFCNMSGQELIKRAEVIL